MTDAFYIIKQFFSRHWGGLQDEEIFSKFSYLLSAVLVAGLFYAEARFADRILATKLNEKPRTNLVFSIVLLTLIFLIGEFQQLSFIYFQF